VGLTLAEQPTLTECCAGAFERSFGLERLSRRALAVLGREWLLHGHLQDRAGMPLFLARATREEMEQLAIDEWMLASPIYSRRMQRTLGFEGRDVATIFKNIQLDIGAPHQFMDFRYSVDGAEHGEFWLAHCGALMDVEPMGDDFVVGMCHHIEDPTFDATAAAANPYAQVRPIHRPPRVPADRHPHCHWRVDVVPNGPPAQPHPKLPLMEGAPIANLPLSAPATVAADGGRDDYAGPLDPDFVLEDLSPRALIAALQEFAVQAHLLGRAYVLSLSDRVGPDTALELGHQVLVGQAGLTAQRLVAAAGLQGGAAGSVATLFQIHPLFHPRTYLDLRVELVDDRRVRLALGPGVATEQPDALHWLACLDRHGPAPLATIAQAIDPRARAQAARADGDERRAYEVVIDPAEAPAPEPEGVTLVKISTGAAFEFRPPDLARA
jgi:hypothetical protein